MMFYKFNAYRKLLHNKNATLFNKMMIFIFSGFALISGVFN